MTIQYLAAASAPTAFFGDRYITIDPERERIIALLCNFGSYNLATTMGLNGQPLNRYSVPDGKALDVYLLKYNAYTELALVVTALHRVEIGVETDDQFTAGAAINPDMANMSLGLLGENNYGSARVWKENAPIKLTYTGGQQPVARVVSRTASQTWYLKDSTLEVYGVERST